MAHRQGDKPARDNVVRANWSARAFCYRNQQTAKDEAHSNSNRKAAATRCFRHCA